MMGIRIAALRKACGMNQKELAQRLKISPSTVGMYEQGRREPSVETLSAMAEIFGVSIDFLVTGKPTHDAEEQVVSQMLRQRVDLADTRLEGRVNRPFSREELAVLFAAMLMEP